MIQLISENLELPQLDTELIEAWIVKTVASYGLKTGKINYIFCNDEKIKEVNIKYLAHDYYTDIITFDYCHQNKVEGDLFISLDTVLSNSEKYNIDFKTELHRVIIHGVLHLCGEDDKTDQSQQAMTKAENKALELLEKMK